MGTNFYFIDGEKQIHIGKQSAAGLFCWDCGLSLCKEGHDKIHYGNTHFAKKCLICGKEYKKETLNESAAGRELGFNKNKPKVKTGVATYSSFTWAISQGQFINLPIKDEYNRIINDFSAILSEYPIKFFYNIGKEFS